MLCQCRWPATGRLLAGLAVGTLTTGALAAAPEPGDIDMQLLHEHSRGRYGQADVTTIGQSTLTLRYHGVGWSAEVQWPWLGIATAANTAGAGLPDSAGRGTSRERGLGDVWWIGRLALRELGPAGPALDLALKHKSANGSVARGLGSGGRDWALQLEFLQPLGPAQLFGHLGWRDTGDVPGFRAYRNPWYGELGLQWTPRSGLDLGGYLSAREPLGRLGGQQDATLFAAWRQGPHRWQLYFSRGFEPASADTAIGLGWRYRF